MKCWIDYQTKTRCKLKGWNRISEGQLGTNNLEYGDEGWLYLIFEVWSRLNFNRSKAGKRCQADGKEQRPEKAPVYDLAQYKYSEMHINVLGMLRNQMNWCPNISKVLHVFCGVHVDNTGYLVYVCFHAGRYLEMQHSTSAMFGRQRAICLPMCKVFGNML